MHEHDDGGGRDRVVLYSGSGSTTSRLSSLSARRQAKMGKGYQNQMRDERGGKVAVLGPPLYRWLNPPNSLPNHRSQELFCI